MGKIKNEDDIPSWVKKTKEKLHICRWKSYSFSSKAEMVIIMKKFLM